MPPVVFFIALLASAGVQVSTAGVAPIAVDVWRAELSQASDRIAASTTLDDGRAAAATTPDVWVVRVDGRTISVDARWIDEEVASASAASWPLHRERITTRLATMASVASVSPAAPLERVDGVLAAVLARPEFRRSATSILFERLREKVAAWILRVFSRFTGMPVAAGTLATVLAWIASLAALAALALWLVSALTARSRAASLGLGSSTPPRAPAREWARRALAALRDGDAREAVRCGYHAALCRLEEQGIWKVDESRTPREYARLLPGSDPRREPVVDLTRQFEQIWYGRRPATAGDAERLSANLERLGCVRAADRTI